MGVRAWARPSARSIGLAVIALLASVLAFATPARAAVGDAPTGLGPDAGSSQSGIPTLSWDWMRDARSYTVQISSNGDFSGTLLDNVTTSNVSYTPRTRLPSGTIWWRVSAKYGAGDSGFSQASFDQAPPPTPTLSRPRNGTTLTAPEQPLVFDWEPVAGATSYDVQISDDPQFGRVLSTTGSKTTTLTLPSRLPARGTYYWRVQAKFPNDVVSGFPDPLTAWSYTIASHPAANALPVAPAIDSVQPTPVMQDVALAWPNIPGATTYTLMVSTDQDFKESSALVANIPNLRGTRYAPPVTWLNDDYYWRVQGFDASDNALGWWPTSGGWKFQRNWPDDVVQQWPDDGATITDPAQLYLQWKPIKHASRYDVVTSSSPTMSDARVCSTTNTTFTPYWTTSNQAQCVPTPGTPFYWQVIGYDQSSNSAAGQRTEPLRSETRSFTFAPPAPAGALASPVPVEAGIRGALSGTAFTPDTSGTCDATLTTACQNLPGTPTLSWPAVPGADGYAVWVSHDQALSNLYPSGDVITTQGSTWTLPSELADSQANQSYWIAVKACTTHVDCTKTFVGLARAKFNVLSQPVHLCGVTTRHDGLPDNNPVCGPEAPKSTTMLTNDNVTFDWSDYLDTTRDAGGGSVSGGPGVEARYYQVQTSTTPDFTTTIDDAKVDQTTFTSTNHTYPDGPIYWRVRAWDGSSNPLRWSSVSTFDKRSEAPAPTAPVDAAAVGTAPQLEWAPTDNTKSYNVEVYKDDNTEFGPANRVQAVNTLQAKWTFTSPLPTGKYLWRVQRVDADGRLGPWSAQTSRSAASFTVQATDFAVSAPYDESTLYPTSYSFSWAAQADAAKYRFEKQPPSGASTESDTTAALTWSPKALPANNTSWRWRVVPVDTAGHDLPPSPWRTFTFVSAPTATSLSVDGQPQVGSTLKALAPAWSLGDVTTTFQWYYGSVSPSNAIPVQNNAPELFTPTAADVNKSVVVVATGTRDGFADGTVTSATYKITLGAAPQLAQSLVLDGSGEVDTLLTATPAWTDPHVTTKYQWLRDGKTIYGQTTNSYKVQATDFGHTLSLQVTGSLPGMANGVFVSAPTTVLAGASLVATSAPNLSGSAKAGSYLYVNRGSWTNSPTSFAYQWLRDSTPIAGQTGSSYHVMPADIGHRVAARVTAARAGYEDGTAKATSAVVPKVLSRTSAGLASYSVTRRAHAKVLVTVTAPPIANATGRLRAYVGRKLVRSVLLSASSHGKKTISLPRLGKGRHTVSVRYLGNHLTRASSSYKLTLTVTS